MDEALHPSTLSEILDRTVQIYRQRFLVFVGIAAVPTAAVLVPVCGLVLVAVWLGASITHLARNTETALLAGVGILVVAPVWSAVTALATAAMNDAASRGYVSGERVTIRGAYKEAWRRGWRYVGLYVLEGLLVWVAPIVVWILLAVGGAAASVAMRGAGTDALLGIGAFVAAAGLIGYAIWMLLRLSLAFAASVVEEVGVMAALKRSAALSKGTKGRIFLLYLLGTVLYYLLMIAVTIPMTIVLALIPGVNGPQHAQTMAAIVLAVVYGTVFAAQVLIRPVYAIALVLFYYDQRIRQEGFDIEWMMQRAGLVAPAPALPEAQPWMPAMPIEAAAAQPETPQTEEAV
ncbi:MAG: DUF7544 domain-containing protein [Terracidiphilus sp.]